MTKLSNGFERSRGIAFVGNFPPRRCGIATFTHDLAESVASLAAQGQPVTVCAMNDVEEGYDYPDRVRFEVHQDNPMDYARAADFLNFSRIDVVSLQHEFGIFGGVGGANILTLLKELRWPLVVTFHTVRKDPNPVKKEVFIEIAARAGKIVAMSQKAVELMETVYGIDRSKVMVIPHGVHDMPFVDPTYFKDKFGVEGRKVLLTFGLIARHKGIEDVIEALPDIVAEHPKVTYVVLGATHPEVLRAEGESYRLELQRRVVDLGLENHVLFHPRFVEVDELLEYLGASDILVTPYHKLDQITSGALSYAMGAGKVVVSTPYWHAKEMLADGRGRLVGVGDIKALAKTISELLDDEVERTRIRKQAFHYCRNMIWPKVARRYLDLFDEVRSRMATSIPVASAISRKISVSNIPTPRLDHVVRLSDDTGICHYAVRALPNWSFGYHLEDQAIALVVASKFYKVFGTNLASSLAERYLRLICFLLDQPNGAAGRLSYSRNVLDLATETAVAKSVWALGYAVSNGPSLASETANDLFNDVMSSRAFDDANALPYVILGSADYLTRFPGASQIRRGLKKHAESLSTLVQTTDWSTWWQTSDMAVPIQALAVASYLLNSDELKILAQKMTDDLLRETCDGTVFLTRGNNPQEEELPVSVMSFIDALGALSKLNEDRSLLTAIRSAANWFLGENRRRTALYDFKAGSCSDALTASGPNENQGAESTLACLISFLTLYELASADL